MCIYTTEDIYVKGQLHIMYPQDCFFNSELAGSAYTFTALRLTTEQNYYNIYVYLHLHSRELAAYYSMKLNKLHFC